MERFQCCFISLRTLTFRHDMTSSENTDETSLIRAAQRGDVTAFGALVERHHGSVRACLAVRMNSQHDAEDLTQETLIVAFRKLPGIDATLPLGPWLRGIAMNLLANHRRKFRAIPIGMNDELQSLIDARVEISDRESERMSALRECLETLDGPARALVNARYADGATLEELAARASRKPSAVSMQLHRLRGLLAECVENRLATI
jgi:RNA polymerase sigma-70 factor, ECF subfamily